MAMDPNVMGWDDVLEDDGQEFVILPEGDYTFTVTGFERGTFPGGPVIPPCPKATVTLNIDNDLGAAICKTDFFLYRTVEWRMAAFFRAIGQKKHGEKARMDWNKVIGARGKAHFRPRTYTSKSGESRQANDVERFYDFTPDAAMTPVKTDDLPWGNGGY